MEVSIHNLIGLVRDTTVLCGDGAYHFYCILLCITGAGTT